jgi:hypothetical protein
MNFSTIRLLKIPHEGQMEKYIMVEGHKTKGSQEILARFNLKHVQRYLYDGGGGVLVNEDLSFCLVNSGPFKGTT